MALIALPLQSCTSSAQPQSAPQMPPALVQMQTVKTEQVEDSSSFVGTLKSRHSVSMSPQVSGQIAQIFVHNGDEVPAGAKLLELDKSKQMATVHSFEAAIASSESERNNAQELMKSYEATKLSRIANLKYARNQHARYSLLQQQGAVSMESLDQWENQMKAGEGDLQSVEAQIAAQSNMVHKQDQLISQAKAALKEQEEQLRYFTIRAPFAGTVGDIPVKLGEYVTPSTMLTTVDQRRPLELYLSVPAADAVNLKKNMNVDILDKHRELMSLGTVFFISPQADASTQTVLVKSLVDNKDDKLRSGQNVPVRLIWAKHPGVVVPTSAVVKMSGQDFVFIASGEGGDKYVAKQKAIKLGEITGNDYIVLSGVKAGDKVVVSGVQNLVDGAPVAPQS